MKLLWIVFLILILDISSIEAKDYLHYQTITFETSRHKFLHEFSSFDMIQHLHKIEDKRFWGWELHEVTTHEKVIFTKETVLFILNEGTTPITQSYILKSSEQSKIQYDTRGTISTKNKGK